MSSANTKAVVVERQQPNYHRYDTPQSAKEKVADKVFWVVRIAIIVNIFCLFLPELNPGRLSALINKNLSLFSAGLSYSSLTSNIGVGFKRGWVTEESFQLLYVACLLLVIGIVIVCAAGVLSLGNRKLKKLSTMFFFAGGILQIVGIVLVNNAYLLINQTENVNRVKPVLPGAVNIFVVVAIVFIVLSIVNFLLIPRIKKGDHSYIEPKFQLFLMMLPVIALAFVFSYLPLYGWRYAFYDYNAGGTLSPDKFVGLKWFTQLFENEATKRDIFQVLTNTLAMSGLGILTSWVPMAFAIFLSEIKNSRFRRAVQVLTTIPNFISWVLVYAIALALFSTDGFINTLINSMGGDVTTNYLLDNSNIWLKMLAWGLWKGVGWSAIIYIASISGIDQSLYEAATVDGAGRFAKMWHITVPELMPTFFVLLLMAIANILSNGMEQYLVFSNHVNKQTIQVLDLYVYNLGIDSGLIPLSTVVGMVKSIISVILLFSANAFSKAVRGNSIV